MTEKTIYIADDGKEFEDKVDCRLYERKYRVNPMFDSGAIVMWNRDKKRTTETDEAFYVSVRSLPAARALKDIFDEDGYDCPCYNFWSGELETGKFYYDENYGKWHNLDELKFRYNSLCEIFAS